MTTNFMLGLSWFGFAWYWYLLALAFLVIVSSFVLIRERQVGVVVKRFAKKSLLPGHLIALAGEAGLQADMLAPGLHFGYWPWQYRVIKLPVTVVPQGEIALVVAAGGPAGAFGAIIPPWLGDKSRAVTEPIGVCVDCEPPKD